MVAGALRGGHHCCHPASHCRGWPRSRSGGTGHPLRSGWVLIIGKSSALVSSFTDHRDWEGAGGVGSREMWPVQTRTLSREERSSIIGASTRPTNGPVTVKGSSPCRMLLWGTGSHSPTMQCYLSVTSIYECQCWDLTIMGSTEIQIMNDTNFLSSQSTLSLPALVSKQRDNNTPEPWIVSKDSNQ